MATWIEFSIAVDPELVEPVSAVFRQHGDGGVAIEEPITPVNDEPGFIRHDGRPVMVRTYIAGDDRGPRRRRAIEEAIWHLNRIWPVGELQVTTVDDEDWANTWKQFYTVQRIGRRTVIKPRWLEYDAQPDDVVVELDPGMAFGTGQHPTTQHCLALLEDLVQPGMRVLDVGAGSGILSIAALKLGAAEAVLLDIDPVAARAAGENIAENDLAERATVDAGTLPHRLAPDGVFDLVLANIIASAIIGMARQLHRALKPGGAAIVSGIIDSRAGEVIAALEAAGFRVEASREESDWRSFVVRCIA